MKSSIGTLEIYKLGIDQESKLKELCPSLKAHYRTGEDQMCLEGTRAELLGNLKDWLQHFKSLPLDAANLLHRLFYLYGLAGSGKSSVANTIAQWIEQEGFYLSCFFCKRDDPELSDPRKVLPTLAFRVAQHHGEYRAALVGMLNKGSASAGVLSGDIDKQYDLLFKDLLKGIRAPPRSHVIVVDALDECENPGDQKMLAQRLLALAEMTPWIKIIITSRPESDIREVLDSSTSSSCKSSNLYAEKETGSDIRRYIEAKFSTMNEITPLDADDVNRLMNQAAGLFIWISTFIKYIADSRNKERDLRRFLSGKVQDEPLQQLYILYDSILDGAIDLGHQDDARVLRAILGLIFVTSNNRPLSAKTLSTFLRFDSRYEDENSNSVRNATRALHAVLYEDESLNGAIRAYHPSFIDFLRDRIGKDAAGWMSSDELRLLVFESCFSTLKKELRFNICKLKSSFLFNKDVPGLQESIAVNVSEALQYSTLFWFAHLSDSGLGAKDERVQILVSALLKTPSALFWLEVLSLMKAVEQGVSILRRSAEFFSVFFSPRVFVLEKYLTTN